MGKALVSEEAKIRIIDGYIDLALIARNVPGLDAIIGDETITLVRKWVVRGSVRKRIMKIRRYINADLFSEFLGLYVSDGNKKFNRVRFSNTNIQYHKKVAEVLKRLGARKLIAYVYYDGSNSKRLKEAVALFEALTGAEIRGIYFDKRAKNPLFELDVCSKPLAIFLLAAEATFRKDAVAGRVPRRLVARYLRGVIEGDGNIRIRLGKSKRGEIEKAEGVYLRISEKNKEIAEDYFKILERYYKLKLHSYGYDHVATLNLQHLLELLHDEIFPDEYADKIRHRLLIAFKRKGIPWMLLQLVQAFGGNAFTTSEASEVLGRSKGHVRDSLMSLRKIGLLKSWKKKISEKRKGTPIRRFFKLTRKASKIAKALLPSHPPLFSSLLLKYPNN